MMIPVAGEKNQFHKGMQFFDPATGAAIWA